MKFRQVHLDFHTSEKIEGIGEKFDKKQFQEALRAGHIDSITLFSKCHHGWAYHPSKANDMHPHLKFDLLKAQIEAAHEIGVKTPVYVSAGFDEKIARRHPDWIFMYRGGHDIVVGDFSNPGYHRLCMNSPYLDYLAEQVKEVCRNYDADGIFMDIVGEAPCYCMYCYNILVSEGKDPYDENDAKELAIRTYAKYTKTIRDAIDSVKPGLPLFHNGGHVIRGRRDMAYMNTHLELESLPTGGWGYDHFPLSAAYARTLGMEYLGMTGKFHTSWGEFGGFKHPNALRFEIALSAAFGAKCSVGDQLHPSGEMNMATYKLMGEAYGELEEREEWCDNVTPVADIAILSSEAVKSALNNMNDVNTNDIDAGTVRMMLEGKYLFNVIDLLEDFGKYKVLILPDSILVDDSLKEKLKAFTAGGGKVLATGKSGLDADMKDFVLDFGAKHLGDNEFSPDYFRPKFDIDVYDDTSFVMYERGQKIENIGGTELGIRENPYFNRARDYFCSHLHTPNNAEDISCGYIEGKDGIYISWPVFCEYAKKGSLILKKMVCYALDRLLGEEKTLVTSLPAQGVATLNKQEGENRYVGHFLYASPVARGNGIQIVEDIVPIYGTTAEIKVPEKVKKVYAAPSKEAIPFEQTADGKVKFTIDKIENAALVVLEY